jgi:hypothetical protein
LPIDNTELKISKEEVRVVSGNGRGVYDPSLFMCPANMFNLQGGLSYLVHTCADAILRALQICLVPGNLAGA